MGEGMMRLTNREKLLAVSLVIVAAAWLLFAFVVAPAIERIDTLSRVIPQKHDELRRLRAQSVEYASICDSLGGLRSKMTSQEDFELLPFLESLISRSNLTKNVESMKQEVLQADSDYNETVVEVKLFDLTLPQLLDFLTRVESSNVLAAIKSLYIAKSPENADLLDSTVQVSNIKLIKN